MIAPKQAILKPFLLYWLPVLLYITVILTLSAQPNLHPPLEWRHSDKVYHLAEYGLFGVLLSRAFHGSLGPRRAVLAAALVLLFGMCMGAGDEYFQSFIPGRESSVYDWMADATGVVMGQLLYLFSSRQKSE